MSNGPTFQMQECPDCKTLSIPANNVCINCNTRWITRTIYNISLYEVLMGLTLGVVIVACVIGIL